ncbi:MAG: UbiA family prenyltransferase [Desulfosarcina sp.]|nr:UbiA family prenyltransferase [Desulfosarcina sp.]MBC2743051.1 UbiA family prenyltransferase [Desulfosarcina sp.]MBC2765961.1 UbiA family prenyltransferase [Desulfosarcina sp.]
MKLESTLKNILNFTKIEHTAFSLPLIFTGAWLGAGNRFPSITVMLLIVVAAVGARIFGMAMNRVFDRHIDRLNPRTAGRELPAGKMTLSMALAIAFTGLVVYLLACGALDGWCLILSPIPLVPLLGYSLLKRFTPFCHFGVGLCLALAPLGAYVAAAGYPRFSGAVILFSGFVFCWMSGADIIYALMDIDHDREHNIHSLPARLGADGALRVAGGVHLMAWGILVAVVQTVGGGLVAWMALVTAAIFFGLMYVPAIPVPKRFFPISTLAGIAGALAPIIS